jgi:hypothetical protein
MPSLSDTQALFRDAVTGGPPDAVLAGLRCPADPQGRLDIYRRHHRESFRRHLRGRYPTLEWLLGTDQLVALADDTLRRAPPRSPSMAEYGQELVDTVLARGEALPPYIADVARLDWALGCISVATDSSPIGIDALASVVADQLEHVTLTLQPGLAHVTTAWPVDGLVQLRLADAAPEQLAFAAHHTHLELRGARGRFTLRRLAAAELAFRARLAAGESLGHAAELALALEASFDVAAALAALFAEGLVTTHSGETRHA